MMCCLQLLGCCLSSAMSTPRTVTPTSPTIYTISLSRPLISSCLPISAPTFQILSSPELLLFTPCNNFPGRNVSWCWLVCSGFHSGWQFSTVTLYGCNQMASWNRLNSTKLVSAESIICSMRKFDRNRTGLVKTQPGLDAMFDQLPISSFSVVRWPGYFLVLIAMIFPSSLCTELH